MGDRLTREQVKGRLVRVHALLGRDQLRDSTKRRLRTEREALTTAQHLYAELEQVRGEHRGLGVAVIQYFELVNDSLESVVRQTGVEPEYVAQERIDPLLSQARKAIFGENLLDALGGEGGQYCERGDDG